MGTGMRTLAAFGVMAALVLCLAPAAVADEEPATRKAEEKVTIEQVPAAVRATIEKEAAGAKIEEIEKKTTKDGKTLYEAEWKAADGKEVEIKVAEDGTLLGRKVEESLTLEQLPAPVRATIEKEAAGAKIEEIEKKTTKDGKTVYEAEWKNADGKEVEVKVAEDGTLLKKKTEGEKKAE